MTLLRGTAPSMPEYQTNRSRKTVSGVRNMHRQVRINGKRQNRRGAAMMEFAIVAPLFLTLVLGILEAGQALHASNVMAAAVREGGRLAAMDWNDFLPEGFTPNTKVIADTRNFLT